MLQEFSTFHNWRPISDFQGSPSWINDKKIITWPGKHHWYEWKCMHHISSSHILELLLTFFHLKTIFVPPHQRATTAWWFPNVTGHLNYDLNLAVFSYPNSWAPLDIKITHVNDQNDNNHDNNNNKITFEQCHWLHSSWSVSPKGPRLRIATADHHQLRLQ